MWSIIKKKTKKNLQEKPDTLWLQKTPNQQKTHSQDC